MSDDRTPGLCVIYRFRLKPGAEQQFVDGWKAVTLGLRDQRGGLGSRLHRGPDGIWYAYAQWPSAEARQRAFAGDPVDADASQSMRDAIEEHLPEIVLDPVVDLLVH
ncbi:MAG: antibiotic biosynthesis monooxygenase family protein [Planctomycetota bacterium]